MNKDRIQVAIDRVLKESGVSSSERRKGMKAALQKLKDKEDSVLLATWKKYRKEVSVLVSPEEENRAEFLWGVLDWISLELKKRNVPLPGETEELF